MDRNVSLWRSYRDSKVKRSIPIPFPAPGVSARHYPYAVRDAFYSNMDSLGKGIPAVIDTLQDAPNHERCNVEGKGIISVEELIRYHKDLNIKYDLYLAHFLKHGNPSLLRSCPDSKIKNVSPFPGPGISARHYPYMIRGEFYADMQAAGKGIPAVTDILQDAPNHEKCDVMGKGIISIEEFYQGRKKLNIKYNIDDWKKISLVFNIHNSKKINLKYNIHLSKKLTLKYDFLDPVRKLITFKYDILDAVLKNALNLKYDILEVENKRKSLSLVWSLLQDPSTVFISHAVTVKIGGIDVSNKVESAEINIQADGFRECSIKFKDMSLYPICDPLNDFGTERIEITIDAETFNFLMEERSESVDVSANEFSIWGRDITATLDMPFIKPYKTDLETRNYTALEIINLVRGLITVNWELPDFVVYSETYSIIDKTPIQVIRDIADICGGLVMSADNGEITVYSKSYDLSGVQDFSYDDTADIFVKDENDELPEGYNVVTVKGYEENTGEHSLDIDIMNPPDCIKIGRQIGVKIWGWQGMAISVTVKNEQGGSGGSATYLYDGFGVKDVSTDVCWPETDTERYYQKWKVIPSTDGEISICVEEM